MSASIFALVVAALTSRTLADNPGQYGSYNGLAVTPAMGWDNWNAFGCDVSEDLLLGTAQKIVEIGFRDLGYNHVILDDCYSDGRYENGSIKPNFQKFPNGFKHVSDRIHSLGLKYGMYSSAGYLTCGRYTASLGRETIDAQTFADWGVDFLKYDNCYNGGQSGTAKLSYDRYKTMSDALNATGRPIVYNMCSWGDDGPWNWAQTIANSWRMSGDIYDSFSRADERCPCTGDEEGYLCALPGFHCSVLNIMNKMAKIVSKTQTGAQNDMDALEVGNGGMTDNQYLTHMSIWTLEASQLVLGTDIRTLTPEAYSILAHPAVIALNQDPMVSAGARRWVIDVDDKDENGVGNIQLWTRTMNNTDTVLALVNAGSKTRDMNATMADLFIDSGGANSKQAKMNYDIYDLWAYRMDNDTAAAILNGTASNLTTTEDLMQSMNRWNTSVMSYAEGLNKNATALFGKKIGSVTAGNAITASAVPPGGVALYRLRVNETMSSMSKRDEL